MITRESHEVICRLRSRLGSHDRRLTFSKTNMESEHSKNKQIVIASLGPTGPHAAGQLKSPPISMLPGILNIRLAFPGELGIVGY